MDWFTQITGFEEKNPHDVRARLSLEGQHLISSANGRACRIGTLTLPSLRDLRREAGSLDLTSAAISVSVVQGDVRTMHAAEEYRGALFQVASQFNMLEMVAPDVTPEDGVTRYQFDRTQGPACAIAAGAATIYRNYFVSVGGGIGQTASHQLDGLADLGRSLSERLDTPVSSLWSMQNGYALCTEPGLAAVGRLLAGADEQEIDPLRAALRIGLHHDVEVTDRGHETPTIVSQAFCSALPVAYSRISPAAWAGFATLVLEAAYEATMLAAALNAQRGASNIVLLTLLGGGAFGNADAWIYAALRRALTLAAHLPLDVRIVSYGPPSRELVAFVDSLRS